jgi:uncharacterized membrane protein
MLNIFGGPAFWATKEILVSVAEDQKRRELLESDQRRQYVKSVTDQIKAFVENDIPIPKSLKEKESILVVETCIKMGRRELVDDMLPMYRRYLEKNQIIQREKKKNQKEERVLILIALFVFCLLIFMKIKS